MSELSTRVGDDVAEAVSIERTLGTPVTTGKPRRRPVVKIAALLLLVVALFALPFVVNSYLLFVANLTLVYAIGWRVNPPRSRRKMATETAAPTRSRPCVSSAGIGQAAASARTTGRVAAMPTSVTSTPRA